MRVQVHVDRQLSAAELAVSRGDGVDRELVGGLVHLAVGDRKEV